MVLCPFERQFEDIYSLGILPVADKFPGWRINICRADTEHPRGSHVVSHVKSLIADSDLLIGDITGANPNVMYEMGMAEATGRATVIITQDEVSGVPTDLEGRLRVVYSIDDLEDLTRQIIKSLRHQVESIVKGRAAPQVHGPGRSYWKGDPKPPHRHELPREATEQRDLGCAARDRQELESSTDYFSKAIELVPDYWEAKYDLALVLSRLKYEEESEALARQVTQEASAANDCLHTWKAHNLLSGIYKRRGDLPSALEDIRIAYEVSHRHDACNGHPPHIVPIKNRAALECLCGNEPEFERMAQELSIHPMFDDIRAQLEKEIGRTL